ncbi:MAG: hypothetical protein OEY49_03410 [Candidatus Heimdallarchaeota archaeon]|nr:hypothetical protein [Candidatus Heimdallarchaeota archaeon]
MEYTKYILLIILPYILFTFCFYLKKKEAPSWVIRKFLHVTGLTVAAVYGAFLDTIQEVIIFMSIFLLTILLLSVPKRIRLIQSLFIMGTRPGESVNVSIINTTLTTLSTVILLIIFQENKWIFMAGVLSVAFGDGLGEFIGKPFGKHKYKITGYKSIEGSFGVFIGSYLGGIIAFLSFNAFIPSILFIIIITSIIAMLIEAISFSMFDNIFMPFGVAYALLFLI